MFFRHIIAVQCDLCDLSIFYVLDGSGECASVVNTCFTYGSLFRSVRTLSHSACSRKLCCNIPAFTGVLQEQLLYYALGNSLFRDGVPILYMFCAFLRPLHHPFLIVNRLIMLNMS